MNITQQTLALLQPFEEREVQWKPQAVKGNRAMMIAFINARHVMDRLDNVVGIQNWQDTYEVLDNNSVKCKLKVRFEDGSWVEKEDVGSPSEQPDEHDKMKAAFSDALKRTAVKFGIGRYLYRLPQQWVEYDPQTRKCLKQPQLPQWAKPQGSKPQPTPTSDNTEAPAQKPQPQARPQQQQRSQQPSKAPAKPANAMELLDRLRRKETNMIAEGMCYEGELLEPIWVFTQDYPSELHDWTPAQIEAVTNYAKEIIGGFTSKQQA